MLASIAWPRGTKTVLGISVILFVAFDLFALAHYDLRHLVPAIRLFYLVNGLSVGVAIPSAVFLWLQRKDRGNDSDAVSVEGGCLGHFLIIRPYVNRRLNIL